MEEPILFTQLNDFIFCPASIYFHMLDGECDRLSFQSEYQINGTAAHERIDEGEYSTKKNILQATQVYTSEFNLLGKIDTFDIDSGILTERKKKISRIYDGYIFQLYAQYFALCELGYNVTEIRFYSISDNKKYVVDLPKDNPEMYEKFCKTIDSINTFELKTFRQQNSDKCKHCIYESMCGFSCEEENYDD